MDMLKSLHHPTELWALIRYNFVGGKSVVTPKLDYESLTPSLKRCYELLNQTSRSFAAVIQALDDELRPAVCIFYLVLRALDTIEDDMSIPHEEKAPMLKEFYKRLQDPQWKFMNSKEKDKAVLEEFPVISAEFRSLKPAFQDIISDITCKMGSGMTVFLQETVQSMEDWDEYCHYVAGLVGIGLSRLFVASGLERAEVAEDFRLANNMGLFLQKTNIIRDYLEDILQGREFWPKKAWSQFALHLRDFQYSSNRDAAVKCLNLLITHTLKLVPDVISYMSRIQNRSVFCFCAIPQTMAIATLALCYNNPAVFMGVVKIRKGQAVQLIMGSDSMESFKRIMTYFTVQMLQKVNPLDPNSEELRGTAEHVLTLCNHSPCEVVPYQQSVLAQYKAPILSTAALLLLSYLYWSTAGCQTA